MKQNNTEVLPAQHVAVTIFIRLNMLPSREAHIKDHELVLRVRLNDY